MKHLLTKLMLMIAPTVMIAKTPILNPNSSASFNIKALDQQFSYSHYYYTPQKITAEIEGVSNCTTNNLIFYNIEIDLHNDGTIDMVASSEVDHDYLTWTKDSLDGKTKCFIAPNTRGNFTFTLPPYPLDYTSKSHKFYWHLYDECGQESKTTSLVYTVDKKAPTPYCVSISTGMMQSNPRMFEAIAIDFDKGAFDNFTPEDKLLFTFEGLYPLKKYIKEEHYYKKGTSSSVMATKDEYLKGMAYRWMPDKRSSSFIFTSCGDFSVNISVWDEAENMDYCTVALKVWCVCILSSVTIHGKVQSVSEKVIKEATIYIDGNAFEYPKIYQTQDGSYSSYHPTILKYFVSADYKAKQTFHVNQKDILRLEAHINGRDPFSHYWQYIAADVNQDKIVDQKDLEFLKSSILAKDSTVWTLINKVDSLNKLNWHKYNTIVTVNGQSLDAKVDFTAILIGDIDGSNAGLDVVQYDSNNEIKSDENDISYKGQDLSNKGTSSFEIIPQDQIFAAHPSPNDPKCTASVQLEAEIKGISNCVSNNLIYYQIEIDLDSDGTIDMIASSHVDKSFTSWTYDEVDKIQKLYVAPDAKGNYIMKLPVFALESKIIRHSVTWKISDECGNVSMQEVTMVCIDKKVPEPNCVSIFTKTDLGGRGREIWAKDLDNGSYDNCTPKEELIFSFNGAAPIYNNLNTEHFYKRGSAGSILASETEYLLGKAYRWDPKRKSAGVFVMNTREYIYVSVWDESWNTYYEIVDLVILSTHYKRKVYGNISNINGKSVKDAQIQIHGKHIFGNYIFNDTLRSTKDGSFTKEFPFTFELEIGAEYITKNKCDVNKKDLEKLAKHLNGQEVFTHYWQYLASDINKDKIVDTRDLLELENLIALKGTRNWLVINNNKLLNVQNWSSYLTEFIVDKWNEEEKIKVDFTAILIGDIDGSSAGLDVIQYDSNDKIESEDNSNSSRGQDFLNKGRFSFNIKANNQVYITNNDCKSLVLLSAEIDGASGCTANNLIYYQIDIDFDSDGTIDMIASSDVDQSYNSWTLDPKDNILKCFMAPNAQGDIIFDVPQFSLGYSTNAHKIHWHIFDKCGASSRTISLFYILDKAVPTAICVSPITSYMQSNPMISELWAKDIDNGSFDICSSKEKLIFTFDGVLPIINRRNEPHYFKSGAGGSVNATATEYVLGKAYRWLPALRSAAKVWTAEGEYKVIFSVFDESGNVGFCNSMLKVIGCDMPLVLKGKVTNVNFKPLKNAVIRADANYPEFPKERLSSNIGLYSFGNFQCGFHYFLTGNFTFEDKKSVNQKDILRLESHLNGQKPFVYYWQFISADINQDKEVNNMDLSLLKTQISNNSIPSWNVFQTNKSLNNFTWREYIQNVKIDSTKMGTIEIDFTAVLIGDVNGSHLGVEVDKIDPNDQISNDDETSKRSLYGFNNTDLKAYPNPYTDQFTIEFSRTQDEVVKLTLMDISGKLGHSMELQSFKGENIFTIQDSFSQTSGIKMIRLESVSGVRHLKLVKTNSYP